MKIYIVGLYNRVAHEYVGLPVHIVLVYADNERDAEMKASRYRDLRLNLDADSQAQYFEVDYLDEEMILSCGDDIKAYLISERKNGKCCNSRILYGKSSAEVRRSLPPHECEVVISVLPKIYDIIS